MGKLKMAPLPKPSMSSVWRTPYICKLRTPHCSINSVANEKTPPPDPFGFLIGTVTSLGGDIHTPSTGLSDFLLRSSCKGVRRSYGKKVVS